MPMPPLRRTYLSAFDVSTVRCEASPASMILLASRLAQHPPCSASPVPDGEEVGVAQARSGCTPRVIESSAYSRRHLSQLHMPYTGEEYISFGDVTIESSFTETGSLFF